MRTNLCPYVRNKARERRPYQLTELLCVQESACVGSVKPFNLNKLISKKTCKDCSEAVLGPIELPESGELMPGETIVKGEITTQVAPIE